MMTCLNCRSTVPDNSRFCEFCGAAISQPTYAPAPLNLNPINQFPQRAREIASGPLMLWLAVLFSAQLAFTAVAAGWYSLALLIAIPELIAYWMIYSNAKNAEPGNHSGLKLLKGYYSFIFVFMVVLSCIAVLALIGIGIIAITAADEIGGALDGRFGEFGSGVAGILGTAILIVAVVVLPITLGVASFFAWAKRKYVRSLYGAVTSGGRPQWSVFIAVLLFVAAFNAFSSIGNVAVLNSQYYTYWMSEAFSRLPPGFTQFFTDYMSRITGYKAVFGSLQAICSCGYAVIAGVIVLKLKNADR